MLKQHILCYFYRLFLECKYVYIYEVIFKLNFYVGADSLVGRADIQRRCASDVPSSRPSSWTFSDPKKLPPTDPKQ